MSVISRGHTPDASEDWAIWQCLTGGVLLFFAVVTVVIALLTHINWAPVGIIHSTGDSMSPTMSADSPTISIWYKTDTIWEEDIIVFRDSSMGDEYVVHRVAKDTPGGLVTKGDGNENVDQAKEDIYPIPEQRVYGTVIWWFDLP